MPETPSNPDAVENQEVRIDLKAPKTAEQWCELYRVLSGKDVYHDLNWGNPEEAAKPLTYEQFRAKAIRSRINLQDVPLIDAVNRIIQK